MTIAARQPIALVIGQFEDIVSRGLRAFVEDEAHLRLLAAEIPADRMAEALAEHTPDVAILNFAALSRPSELRGLHTGFPDVRFMVLADNPTSAECR